MEKVKAKESTSGPSEGGQACIAVSLDMIDRMDDLSGEVNDLADAIECARMAALSTRDDSGEYISGTLSVLMRVSDAVRDKARNMVTLMGGGAL